jgi:hypothetical protein
MKTYCYFFNSKKDKEYKLPETITNIDKSRHSLIKAETIADNKQNNRNRRI